MEVWFELRDGRQMCLPRITQPEPAQAVLLAQLSWNLPQQPPPRVYAQDLPPTGSPFTYFITKFKIQFKFFCFVYFFTKISSIFC